MSAGWFYHQMNNLSCQGGESCCDQAGRAIARKHYIVADEAGHSAITAPSTSATVYISLARPKQARFNADDRANFARCIPYISSNQIDKVLFHMGSLLSEMRRLVVSEDLPMDVHSERMSGEKRGRN